MTLVTQPLRDEHKGLLPHIDEILTVAHLVGDKPLPQLRPEVDQVVAFLTRNLIPHAQAEDEVLYPVIDQVVGSPEALATMRFDHVEIGRLTDSLVALRTHLSCASLSVSQIQELRQVLYGLYFLVKTHFIKEETVFLPILDARLTPPEARHLFEAMEAAAIQAKSALVP